MRVIVDTNVLISGIFFRGQPGKILDAWGEDAIELVASPEILAEYQRVLRDIGTRKSHIDIDKWEDFLLVHLQIFDCPKLKKQISEDPDDDKFIACALSTKTKLIVSGDHHLLDLEGIEGLEILKPRTFNEKYLKG